MAALSADLAAGRTTSRLLVDQALSRIDDAAGEGARAFVKVYAAAARVQADASDALRAAGSTRSIVEGIPVSVKDLYDVAGDVTRAGSKALAGAPPAKCDATAVARLRAAGAIILGRTNTVEFAFGGVGLNPHYGTPKNPWDRATGRVPGGSSAGAAVAVADGMGAMALGSDTRGSVRIPAALCGVTGFKPTQSRVPRLGTFPLMRSLDSVGPLANSVACCAIYDAILAGEEAAAVAPIAPMPLSGLRLLLPRCSLFDDLDPVVERAFSRAVQQLRNGGAHVVERDAPLFTQAQDLYKGPGFLPEAVQVHRELMEEHREQYDPRVLARIEMGASVQAVDYVQVLLDRSALISKAASQIRPFDAMIYPTVKDVAPSIEAASSSDEEYFRINGRVLYNTGLVNLLDGCAVSLPCHSSGEAPVGLSVVGPNGADKHILAVALAVESALASIVQSGSSADDEPAPKKARL